MTSIDAIMAGERIIGRKAILAMFGPLYDIHTWQGAVRFIRDNNFPLRRTPAGRPMFLRSELMLCDVKFQKEMGQ